MAKSDKFDNAVARATGNQSDDAGAMVAPPGTEGMLSKFTPEDIQAKLATGKYEAAPQLLSLKPGQQITGILEGHGPAAEFIDNNTGEVKEVATWIIADPSGTVRVSILSSAQLDKKCNGFIGGEVTIARGNDVNIGGSRRMTEYFVFGPKLPGGKRRQWFDMDDKDRVIDAPAAHHALPVGSNHASETPAS
jgi:hypothetical protein